LRAKYPDADKQAPFAFKIKKSSDYGKHPTMSYDEYLIRVYTSNVFSDLVNMSSSTGRGGNRTTDDVPFVVVHFTDVKSAYPDMDDTYDADYKYAPDENGNWNT
jgi:hypothetical protein